jgi:hypothetical protein
VTTKEKIESGKMYLALAEQCLIEHERLKEFEDDDQNSDG